MQVITLHGLKTAEAQIPNSDLISQNSSEVNSLKVCTLSDVSVFKLINYGIVSK